MKKDPLKNKKYELLRILKEHDVQGMKAFAAQNPEGFKDVDQSLMTDETYLFDLIHYFKANLLYMGAQHFESMKYCREKGIITLSHEMSNYYAEAEKNQKEIVECLITPELDQEAPPKPSLDS
jgi:hypothetical protein